MSPQRYIIVVFIALTMTMACRHKPDSTSPATETSTIQRGQLVGTWHYTSSNVDTGDSFESTNLSSYADTVSITLNDDGSATKTYHSIMNVLAFADMDVSHSGLSRYQLTKKTVMTVRYSLTNTYVWDVDEQGVIRFVLQSHRLDEQQLYIDDQLMYERLISAPLQDDEPLAARQEDARLVVQSYKDVLAQSLVEQFYVGKEHRLTPKSMEDDQFSVLYDDELVSGDLLSLKRGLGTPPDRIPVQNESPNSDVQ